MTKFLDRVVGDMTADVQERPAAEKREFYSNFLGDTARGGAIAIFAVATVVVIVLLLVQLFQLNTAINTLNRSEGAAKESSQEIKDISVYAAYCAKLPESNTVARIQVCIEKQVKTNKVK